MHFKGHLLDNSIDILCPFTHQYLEQSRKVFILPYQRPSWNTPNSTYNTPI
jgi:hypothetical protein